MNVDIHVELPHSVGGNTNLSNCRMKLDREERIGKIKRRCSAATAFVALHKLTLFLPLLQSKGSTISSIITSRFYSPIFSDSVACNASTFLHYCYRYYAKYGR